MNKKENLFTGLSGIQLPVPKYEFPEEFKNSSRLTYYSTFFNSIEINSSFYQIPQRATIARWAQNVSENFNFTFKLFKEITHQKNLVFDRTIVKAFIDTISIIGQKKGCLLVQFPPSLKIDQIHKFHQLLECIRFNDTDNAWPVAIEFRDRSWYHEEVYEIISSFNMSLVLQDIPKSATPRVDLASDVVYVRFHGPTGNYAGSYTEAFLHEYAEYINEWLLENKKVYVYFNNTRGSAFENLITLRKLLM